MVHHPEAIINRKESPIIGIFPDIDALRAAWRSLGVVEASASPGCRLGIARRRMELLSVFPSWRIPEIIDALNRPESGGASA